MIRRRQCERCAELEEQLEEMREVALSAAVRLVEMRDTALKGALRGRELRGRLGACKEETEEFAGWKADAASLLVQFDQKANRADRVIAAVAEILMAPVIDEFEAGGEHA